MKTLASMLAALLLLGATTLERAAAQDTRAAALEPVRWTLHPPLEGVPCPSHTPPPDAPKPLVFGTFKLANPAAVIDGDTIRVEGLKESLRFVGLDAEETFKDPKRRGDARSDWQQYVRTEMASCDPARPPKYATFMGEAAKDGMRQLLDGVAEVRVEWDDEHRKIDTFGRNLVFVLFQKDGNWINLNVEMVRQGLSPYFVKYGRTRRADERFAAAQKEAQAHERGIWSDPGRFPHYPDYARRLAWWNERADLIMVAEKLRAERTDFAMLGRDDEWERLKAMAGRKVTVFGSPLEQIKKESVVLLPLSHRRGLDFIIAGSESDVARLALEKELGNLLFVTGVVEIYKGQPQFQAKGVAWSRTPPRGAESAPAQR